MPLLTRPDLRSLASLAVAGSLAAMAAPAAAAPPVDLGGATIKLTLELPDEDGEFAPREELDNIQFMNLANCTCGDAEQAKFAVEFQLENPPGQLENENVEVYAGTSCDSDDITDRRELCIAQDGFADLDELRGPEDILISVHDLVQTTAGSCNQAEESRWVYAIIDENNDGIGKEDYTNKLEILTDTQPPPAPDNLDASGAENGIRVSWELPSRSEDIWYYQLLCARADGSVDPADGLPRVDKQYLTGVDVCGIDDGSTCPIPLDQVVEEPDDDDGGDDGGDDGTGRADAGEGSADASGLTALGDPPDAGPAADAGGDAGGGGDAGTGECADLPGGLETLDPAFLCGEEASPSATSLRASGLQNGVPYHVVLVVVDRSRNPLAIDLGEQTPRLVKDFWEDYKESGGGARGGCSAGQAGLGGGIAVALALILGSVLRRGSRRRRGAGIGGGAVILALALSPRLASAQPWWESYEEPVQEEVGPALPHWNLEIKLGPYVPDVDSEFNLSGDEVGPFELMYGDGPFLMNQITLDRYFLYPMGQLGLSVTGGFMTRSANAYELDADGDVVINEENGRPERSVGDTTTFRLFPASIGAVYRFTELDDRWRIPVVPFGRAGLSYYYWWVSKPGGGVAETPTGDCPDTEADDCEGDRARGGSFGWQATAGLAIRAERIDPDAEVSLRTELGIEHAGLVFEFTYAKVDGFGSGDKLAVGDATFFGGINFEF